LPKTGVFLGTQLGLVIKSGKLNVIDFSSSLNNINTLLRCPKEQKVPLRKG